MCEVDAKANRLPMTLSVRQADEAPHSAPLSALAEKDEVVAAKKNNNVNKTKNNKNAYTTNPVRNWKSLQNKEKPWRTRIINIKSILGTAGNKSINILKDIVKEQSLSIDQLKTVFFTIEKGEYQLLTEKVYKSKKTLRIKIQILITKMKNQEKKIQSNKHL
jgi:hypothetical protein